MQNKFSKQQAQFFNNYAKSVGSLDMKTIHQEMKNEFDALIKILPDIENKRILDLGCGTGRLSLLLAKRAKEVVGLDISKNSVAIANKTANKYKIRNFKGIVGDFNIVT